MKLIGDLLDQQIVDCTGRKFGKVDGIVLELRDDAPPRVSNLEIGAPVLARRIGKRSERWALKMNRFFGVRREPVYRIPFEKVLDVGIDVELDYDGVDEPPLDWERWLRDHIFSKLPFE